MTNRKAFILILMALAASLALTSADRTQDMLDEERVESVAGAAPFRRLQKLTPCEK